MRRQSPLLDDQLQPTRARVAFGDCHVFQEAPRRREDRDPEPAVAGRTAGAGATLRLRCRPGDADRRGERAGERARRRGAADLRGCGGSFGCGPRVDRRGSRPPRGRAGRGAARCGHRGAQSDRGGPGDRVHRRASGGPHEPRRRDPRGHPDRPHRRHARRRRADGQCAVFRERHNWHPHHRTRTGRLPPAWQFYARCKFDVEHLSTGAGIHKQQSRRGRRHSRLRLQLRRGRCRR